MTSTSRPARFASGQIRITPAAQQAVTATDAQSALGRHLRGDWGDCEPDDRAANDQALIDGSRLFSVYHTANQLKFWIITEADRSATTILFPEDY